MLELKSDELDGLPAGIRDAAREKAQQMGKGDKWVFTLHKPSLIPLLTYSTRRDLREKIYKAYLNRCNNGDEYDNKQLINDFIRLRTEKAHLLGYPLTPPMSWRTRWPVRPMPFTACSTRSGRRRSNAPRASWPRWTRFCRRTSPVPPSNRGTGGITPKLRKQNYALDEEMLRPYFSLENVQGGIFYLANRLYGITFQPIVVPLYHPDAVAYEVLDADGSHLGVLYFDYFPRDGKSQGAWCGNYVEQTYMTASAWRPW